MTDSQNGPGASRGDFEMIATSATSAITPTEQRVLDAIDIDALVADLSDLIAIRSDGGEETEVQQRVTEILDGVGLDVDVWNIDLDQVRRHPEHSEEIRRTRGVGLVGVLEGAGDAGRDLILNGHTDVVPAGLLETWSVPPWHATVQEGRVYGRGAADMKGGLCCAIAAARALRATNAPLQGRVLIQSVIGEEDGGTGTLAALMRGHTADGAVIIEPTQLAVVPAEAGSLNFRVTVRGRAAHGGVRNEGVSAIEAFRPVHDALLVLERERNNTLRHPLLDHLDLPWPLSIGTLRAGVWPSSVPEELVCEGRYGVAIGEDVADARRAFEEAVSDAARSDPWLSGEPASVEWWGGSFAPAHTNPDDPLVRTVVSAAADCGIPSRIEGVPYGSDLRLLVQVAGIPAVLFGPGDVRDSHGPDESVAIEDLETATRALALIALRFCGCDE